MRERTGLPPSYANTKKMQLLTLCTHGCLKAVLMVCHWLIVHWLILNEILDLYFLPHYARVHVITEHVIRSFTVHVCYKYFCTISRILRS